MILPPSERQLLAWTIWQEAGGEPYQGKLAVAYVVMNRLKVAKSTICREIMKPWQFSCWNTDSVTRLRLPDAMSPDWEECSRAAMAAVDGTEQDPTNGADHYLNEATVLRVAGKLPSWYNPKLVTARIGHHTFLRLG